MWWSEVDTEGSGMPHPMSRQHRRRASCVLTSLLLGVLAAGAFAAVQEWTYGGEGPTWVFLVLGPFIWVVSCALTVLALQTAQRAQKGMHYLVAIWGGAIVLWVGIPFSLPSVPEAFLPTVAGLFAVGALYVVWRFLLRGGPHTVLGH